MKYYYYVARHVTGDYFCGFVTTDRGGLPFASMIKYLSKTRNLKEKDLCVTFFSEISKDCYEQNSEFYNHSQK